MTVFTDNERGNWGEDSDPLLDSWVVGGKKMHEQALRKEEDEAIPGKKTRFSHLQHIFFKHRSLTTIYPRQFAQSITHSEFKPSPGATRSTENRQA